jgi:hypothetical protein
MSDGDTIEAGKRFFSYSGIAVALGGLLTILVNAGLTPLLDADAPYTETAVSSVFLWRQSLSALAAVLLLIGSVGLFLRQAGVSGRFGAIAFALAFLGSALLLGNEWCQIFFVRGLALRFPDTLRELESVKGPNLFDTGAMLALIVFSLGWIIFSVSMLLSGAYSRRGPIMVMAGFIAIPVLGAALPDMWGLIVGNLVLGCAWILLGRELHKYGGSKDSS